MHPANHPLGYGAIGCERLKTMFLPSLLLPLVSSSELTELLSPVEIGLLIQDVVSLTAPFPEKAEQSAL